MSELKTYDAQQTTERLLAELPNWCVEDGHLCRRFDTDGWRSSMLLANGIAHLAELVWHHPELGVSWGQVVVKLTTHEVSAISDRDFELATMIEQSVAWQPAETSALQGAPAEGRWRYVKRDND